jgi:selenocysteine lyase/cysteine desulfurase
MHKERREFLRAAGAAGAIPIFTPKMIRAVEAAAQRLSVVTAEEAAKDVNFWFQVRQAFTIDSQYLALNAGANNSAPRATLEALLSYIEFANLAPLTNQQTTLRPQREAVRARLAALANCSQEEIALTRNTTEALNIVIAGLPLKAGDEVVATDQDYYSMLNALRQRAERDGITLKTISIPTPPKRLDELAEAIERAITAKTRAILISHIIDPTGQIFPVRRIAEIAHARGAQLIVDGALSFGTIEVDLQAMDCDYYGTSLHKGLHAPLGTGFLYVKRERIAPLWPLFGAAEPRSEDIRKFEAIGTHPMYQIAAVNQALDFHEAIGVARIRARLHYLKRYWADQLAQLANVRFRTGLEADQSCAIANVEIGGIDPSRLYQHLLDRHRIRAWPIRRTDLQGLWVAPFIYTQPRELDRFVSVMTKIARQGLPA